MNDTGSFPDESEKTPMCFLKCFLEILGILNSENEIDKEKATSVYQIEDDNIIDDCSKEICKQRKLFNSFVSL